MNTTTTRTVSLQSGQAFAVERGRNTRLYVIEGEVTLEAPAQWLGGSMLFAPARRVCAPAMLEGEQVASLTASGAAKLAVEQEATALERVWAALGGLRLGASRRPGLLGS